MIKVYTAGYMAGEGSDRLDWRVELEGEVAEPSVCWLHPGVPPGDIPGQGDSRIYTPRDLLQIQKCDIVFAYFDLDVARCLGASVEIGYAYGLGKPIIMMDMSPDIGSLDLNRSLATSVWNDWGSAVRALQFVADGFAG